LLQVKDQLWPLDRKMRVIQQAKQFVRKQEAEMEVNTYSANST
jgi:hypothetical protein